MKYFKKIFENIIARFSLLFIVVGYTIVNVVFNYRLYWRQLVVDLSKTGAVYGEIQVYEWALERFFRLLISGHNPFGDSTAILYPFGLNFSTIDLGYGLFFPLLRPFLSPHQTLSILVTTSLIIANIGMYLLLRKLNFSKMLSFAIGLSYGYMTFLMPRAGHLSYWSTFVFPWFYFFAVSFLLTKNNKIKIFNLIGLSIIFVLTLWLNFYYFVMLLISIITLLIYFLIFTRKTFFKILKENFLYLLINAFVVIFLLTPWFFGLYEMIKFDVLPKSVGWGGAIEFSSDLFNYLIPSGYSYIFTEYPFLYKPFVLFLKFFTPNARSIFENFTYPGIIIILCYLSLLFIYGKFDHKTKVYIKPLLFTSAVFFLLTLGPFLHVFGHWTLTVDEGIRIVIPLPYIILHYIPFINNIRVPGRIVVAFIFFAYMVCTYLLSFFLKNKSIRFKQAFFILFMLVFIFDQRVTDRFLPDPQIYPLKIFQEIKADKQNVSVLEVPFTVRDGFTYFGNGGAIGMTVGQLIYDKPTLGGYIGRISDYKKNYYRANSFLGYIGRLIDNEISNNPSIDQNDIVNWVNLDLDKSKNAINFLNLKYIVLDDDAPYSATLSAKFVELGFDKLMKENKFSLWKRNISDIDFLGINLGTTDDINYLGMGWNNFEEDYRWSEEKSFVMFKTTKSKKYNLHFKASAFWKNQIVTIYLNKKKIAKISISTDVNEYVIPLSILTEPGINKVYFVFNKYYRPIDVIRGSMDTRKLSAKFYRIWLTE